MARNRTESTTHPNGLTWCAGVVAVRARRCLRVGRKNIDRPPAIVASLTARVGSIGDNRLGGWYSYRMSKAAMNQFTKTFSLEAARDKCFAVSLHPGTVDTALSEPFQRGVPAGKLFTKDFCASRLFSLCVVNVVAAQETEMPGSCPMPMPVLLCWWPLDTKGQVCAACVSLLCRMLAIVDAVDKDRTGGFFDWDGKAVPW